MIILSLFDGMSCGQIALNRAGIKYDKYYASEIDKYAILITQKNYSNTIQLGDIREWQSWDIEKPDLIIGGSPCQGFSFAGKQLNFNDERSKLFFTFVDILKHYKPKYFLLENVVMKKEYNDVISGLLGELYPECVGQGELFRTGRLEPIQINSALVSAQNRERLYWTNIPNVEQPEDKGILLKDVIENGFTDRDKSLNLDANYNKTSETSPDRYLRKSSRQIIFKCGAIRGRYIDKQSTKQFLEIIKDEKTNTLTSVEKDNVIIMKQLPHGNNKGCVKEKNKSPVITTSRYENNNLVFDETEFRKLTPIECERLQTVSDNYTQGVSNSQRYKMLGNGWTVDVIAHILKGIA